MKRPPKELSVESVMEDIEIVAVEKSDFENLKKVKINCEVRQIISFIIPMQ